MTRVSLMAVVSGVLTGCASSAPMHYYTLSENAPAARISASASAMPVRVDRVTMAAELDRLQVVRRIDPTRLQILENDRWAAPLDDMIHRVLSDDLAARLPANLVADPNESRSGDPRQSLAVDILEFYGDQTCAVSLRASWNLKPPNSAGARGIEEIQVPAGAPCVGGESLPAAMSQALGQLSDRIAVAVAQTAATSGEPATSAH